MFKKFFCLHQVNKDILLCYLLEVLVFVFCKTCNPSGISVNAVKYGLNFIFKEKYGYPVSAEPFIEKTPSLFSSHLMVGAFVLSQDKLVDLFLASLFCSIGLFVYPCTLIIFLITVALEFGTC